MAKEQKKMVDDITSMDEDFAKWYTDICRKAELIEYTSVKGCMVIRPYGYAIWENIQKILDGMFKETGHENTMLKALRPNAHGLPWAETRSLRKGFVFAPLPKPCFASTLSK